jgi:hypothetical protein
MKSRRFLTTAMLWAAGPVAGAQHSSVERELWLRFGQAATRAVANFRSADSIEQSLEMEGNTLHPTLLALKMRIEAALDESEAALNKGEMESAKEAIGRAEGLTDKFAKRLGGD